MNLQRRRFCEAYLKKPNGAAAAREAGYSEDSDRSIASQLLAEPEIQEYLERREREIAESLDITPEKIAAQYARMGFFDIRELFDDNGNIKPVSEWSDAAGAMVAGLEVFEEKEHAGEETFTAGFTKKVKIGDRKAALDSLAKMLGHSGTDKVDITTLGDALNKPAPSVKLPDGTEINL